MNENHPDNILDRTLEEIRNEPVDPTTVRDAAARVWERISAPRLEDCRDFQALIPPYKAGELTPARRLLVEDHLHSCVACRRVAAGGTIAAMPVRSARAVPVYRRYAIAASLLIATAAGYLAYDRYGPAPAGHRATVFAASGPVFRMSGTQARAISTGEVLGDREVVRTGTGAHAILELRDGSRVEIGERSQVAVSATRRDTTLHLERGPVIVEAAKRRTGHLYVSSPDCRVAVTGTVFAVNRGTKGSRVSVVEGEVRVAYADSEAVLRRGQQVATDPSMTPSSVLDEIAWSRNLESHLRLLGEFAELKQKVDLLPMPGLRYSSRLLPLVPANTAIYAAAPNLGNTLADAWKLFEQQLAARPALREWFNQAHTPAQRAHLETAIARIREVSDYIGDEVVMAVPAGPKGQPVFIAEVRRTGLREYLSKFGSDVQVVDTIPAAAPNPETTLVLLQGNFVAASPDPLLLRAVAASIQAPANALLASAFGARIAAAYREGAGILVAANLEQVADPDVRQAVPEIRHVVLEQKELGADNQSSATFTFAGTRQGVASWLGAPGAMGSLEFVSPEATMAAAALVKRPSLVWDDLLKQIAGANERTRAQFAEFEARHGVRVREDIAEALGTEVAFSLDGPLLPTPSWKLVLEVYNPARLQQTIARLAADAKVPLAEEVAAGRTWYVLRTNAPVVAEVHYTFESGYLIACPSRALVLRALQVRASGASLSRSQKFLALAPRDRHANFSGVFYQDAASAAAAAGVTLKPSLIAAYGEDDRIRLATAADVFDFGLNSTALGYLIPGTKKR
jgi:hypothetical protein